MMFPRTSRRSFLKTALAAAAAPLILPSRTWAAETAANDRVTLGVIGIGKMARAHLPGFLGKSEVHIAAVCDVDTTRRQKGKAIVDEFYAKKNGASVGSGCAEYNDFRELLAHKDLNAVLIVTPDHWHAPISLAAAAAGKDIYCEKPLCQTVQEAKAMIDATRKHQRVFQTGSQQRSNREFRIACELVRNGVLGKIKRVTTGFGGPGRPCDLPEEPIEAGLDWNRWLGPAPMRPYNSVLSPRGVHDHFPNWRMYWEYGGGKVTDWGAHHVDIAQWALDKDATGPDAMIPPSDWAAAEHGGKLVYGDVELEHISENGVTFFGENGTLYVNRGQFTLMLAGKEFAHFKKGVTTPLGEQLDKVEKELLKDARVRLTNSTDHKADWLSAIRTRQKPIADVEIGARTVVSCHLLNFGYRFGEKVQWKPETMEFTGGTGKPEWLARAYREGFALT